MRRVEHGTAYLLWALGLFGLCGGQRFYTGNTFSGFLYLFTFGFFGFGQFLDVFFIPGMVNRRNIYLRGLEGGLEAPMPTVTVAAPVEPPLSPIHLLLKAAKTNGGALSLAQATLYTEMEPDEVKELLHDAIKKELAEVGNDPETGAIRYYFDV
ncbi:MAG: NINE protein [Leptolyngbyaceae cyanobacterium]